MTNLEARLSQLSPAKRRLFVQRLRERGVDVPLSLYSLLRTPRPPLSFAQRRLWFLNQLDPSAGAAYHLPQAVRIEGELDVEKLEAAINAVIARHEALRTTFASDDGTPTQLICDTLELDLTPDDLSELDESQKTEQLQAKVRAEISRRFSLENGPLVRARLFRIDENEHIFVVVMHHIISDGWSTGIFIREMVELYQASVIGRPDRLQDISVQYADFALWQREWVEGEVLDTQLAYWKDKLDGLEPLELSTDHPRPPTPTYRGASVAVELGEGLTRKLKDLARQREATLYQTLLAAFQLLLGRYSGQKTFAVGSPIAGRRHADLEGLIGLFLNTLVMRADLSQTPSFDQLLERTRQTTLDAYAHQDIPFEKLVAELEPERDTSRSPLFQVMFVLQNNEQPDIELEGLKLSGWGQRAHTAQFDLSLSLSEQQGRLIGAMTYSTDLFEEQTIEQMVCHFERLLDEVLEAPHRPVEHLEYLSQADHQQLARWNDTGVDYGVEQCLHELIEAQVARTPRAKALVFEGESVSYAELDRRANQLAHRLQAEGVGPESIVGLMAERSFEMVVGLLGILKAGAAYVPLDPEYPTARLAYMLEHAGVKVVVSQEALVGRVPEAKVAKVVCLEDDSLQDQPPGRVQVDRQPHHSAYVLFTSGSTGKPKGVLIEHRAIVNRLLWMQHAYRLEASDRVLQKTTYTFDVSVWEFFWPLMFGAALVVARPDGHKDPGYLADVIASERVTTMHFVPSMLRPFLQEPALEQKCTSLRRVICSGEALPPDSVKTFYERVAHAELHNLYGPTEAAIDVTAWPCPDTEQLARVYIGRPVANTKIHIVDAHFNPCAPGVPGELCIGGVQLARGYVNRPDLSARQFVVDPFSDQRGARMYRTGDKARWTSQGQVEYLGRLDFQVKLRGLRIELGEIEAVLVEHPHVRHAAVGVWHSAAGHEMLVAWVVGAQGLEIQQLREHAGGALPEYMVPAQFVQLDQMPLTSSGKTDRKKLPEPDLSEMQSRYEAPASAVEETLVEVWGELLGIDRIGRHDDFFALGGHSLLVTRLISQIRRVLDVEIGLRQVFEHSKLSQLAELVEQTEADEKLTTLPPIEPIDHGGQAPLSFAQQRLWFLEQLDASSAAYNMPVAVRLVGEIDVDALESALNAVVNRHDALRTTFDAEAGQPLQRIAKRLRLELSPARSADLSAELTQQALEAFDIGSGPLVRVKLFEVSETEFVLMVVMHHIISDGWSMGVFIAELAELYRAILVGEEANLRELTVQYPDFAVWQRQWLEGEELDRQLLYWQENLAGVEPLELPSDRPRPVRPTFRGAHYSFEVGAEVTDKLNKLALQHQATLYQVLLASFQLLLGRYTRQSDVAIGSPIAGRRHADLEGLIGFFVNTLVMRSDLSGSPSFKQLLEQVKQTTVRAYEHQDVPFERLVQRLQPVRDSSRHPLFQVMFVLQNNDPVQLGLPNVELIAEPFEQRVSKFDLTLNMREHNGVLRADFEYATDLFDQETIARLSHHLENVFAQVAENSDQPIDSLQLLDAIERRRVVVDFNNTRTDFEDGDLCAHELFERQVDATPDATALACGALELTYVQLDGKANQLARFLIEHDVHLETRVGICMERSPEMVVAMLAVLKAGGAYVPLDPDYPAERLQFMADDAALALVLSQRSTNATLPQIDASRLVLDAEQESIEKQSTQRPMTCVYPQSLAYMIYTSGSTGRPKGVQIPQRGLVNLVHAQIDGFAIDQTSRVLQFAAFSFDASVSEVFTALCAGATLVLPEAIDMGAEVLSVLDKQRITTVTLPPSLLAALEDRELPHLETLVSAGEACSGDVVARWGAGRTFINAYGPSENSVCATMGRCRADEPIAPIGRPIANVQVYILDERMEPVPIGVAGELCIGGRGLGRGYLDRAQLTAERFVPDPFGDEPGSRLYRTGDLVRHLRDGRIEFLGRIDHQVKVRGFRIELGEVEDHVRRHPRIEQCAVVARGGETGRNDALIGYVVARPLQADAPDQALDTADLVDFLRARLPSYMIPSQFVELGEIPRTPSGKLDRRNLPDPAEVSGQQVPPRDGVELKLARIWEELLGVDSVGVEDDFFERGGHSLLAVAMMTKIEEAFGRKLSVSRLLASPTIARLATSLRTDDDEVSEVLVPLKKGGSQPGLFLIHPVGGEVFCYLELARGLGGQRPVYGLRSPRVDASDLTIPQMAKRYVNQIRQVQPEGPYLIGGWSMGGMVALEVVRQLRRLEERVDRLFLIDAYPHRQTTDLVEAKPAAAAQLFVADLAAQHGLEQADVQVEEEGGGALIDALLERSIGLGLLPVDFERAQLVRRATVFERNRRALQKYQAGTTDVPICYFHALRSMPRDGVISLWEPLAAGGIEVHSFDADHFSLLSQPLVERLISLMDADLNQAALPSERSTVDA